MRLRLLVSVAVFFTGMFFFATPAFASIDSLKVTPLEFRTVLKKDEKKKAYIDIGNPTNQKQIVSTSVEGFRYIDNKPTLQFFYDERLTKGIKLDLDAFELGPRQVLRMYFIVDGKSLPPGDVFATIFFTTKSEKARGVNQNIRVGSMLSIQNGTPGERKAEITNLSVPFFQSGDTIHGQFTVRNTGSQNKSTGFYPEVTTKVWPDKINQKQLSVLVFAGHERQNEFVFNDLGFGLHVVSIAYQGSSKWALVFTAEPIVYILAIILLVVILAEVVLWQRRVRIRRNRMRKSS